MTAPVITSPEQEFHLRVNAAMDEAGSVLVPFIQGQLSDPYPPSSTPETAPHLRSGRLREGIHHETLVDGTLVIWSDAFYSIFLKLGTSQMDRRALFNDLTDEQYADVVYGVVRSRFS